MFFVLVIVVIVVAGWFLLARNANGASTSTSGPDDYVPVNAYDNPYETNENNDAPFEPDTCSDASGDSSSDGSCDSGDSSSAD